MGYINLGPYHKLTNYTSKNSRTTVLRRLPAKFGPSTQSAPSFRGYFAIGIGYF